jgi:hypothetical protein
MTSLENGVPEFLQDRLLLTVPTCSAATPSRRRRFPVEPKPVVAITVVIDHWQAAPRSGPLPHGKVFIQVCAESKLHFGRTFKPKIG